MIRHLVRARQYFLPGAVVVIAAVAVVALTHRESTPDALPRIDVTDVGYVNSRGAVPPSAPTGDPDQFSRWRQDLKFRLSELLGFGEPGPQSVVTELTRQEFPGGELVRETMTFVSFDGTRIPAVLQRLSGAVGKLPAVLLIPGHTKPDESGIVQLVSDESAYQHAAATALARAGFITLTFELRGFGALGQTLNTEHRLVAYNALLEGSFYKRVVLTDARYALALLLESEFVDSERVGVAGASFGGELAVTLAALSDRLSAIYFSGFGGSTGPYRYVAGNRNDQPHYCHIIPGAKSMMRREDMILLLAPRPALGNRGERETAPTDEFMRATQGAWNAFDAGDAFSFTTVAGGGHEFFVKEATEFFKQYLGQADEGS